MDPNTLNNEYTQARQKAVVFDRTTQAKFELIGPEAIAYLHNLCTNDIRALKPGTGCEAFLTTHKARVLAHLAIQRGRTDGDDSLLLDLPGDFREKIYQHLDRHHISEQFELKDRTDELAQFHLVGPASVDFLDSHLHAGAEGLGPWSWAERGNCRVRRNPWLGRFCFDLFCPVAEAPQVFESVRSAGIPMGSAALYETLRVEAGLPLLGIDMDENRFVVEVGRSALAISYTKGCYLGQEPIVMARDRGQVNRRLMGLLAGEGQALAPGTRVFQGDNEVGQVTSSIFSPGRGQVAALAYLRRGCWDPGVELVVNVSEGPRRVTVAELPLVI